MPQNTPMKRQFTTIDGRTVMSNLPQHWGGNDWAITGVDNPLPVGNYVQTEAGVWIPQKGSDDGAADVRLTGSNVVGESKIIPRSVYTTTQIIPNITPPDGAVSALVFVDVRGVTGSFSQNQGYSLYARTYSYSGPAATMRGFASGWFQGTSGQVNAVWIMFNPYATVHEENTRFGIIPATIYPRMRVDLRISGDFQSGEGIDAEVNILWFK